MQAADGDRVPTYAPDREGSTADAQDAVPELNRASGSLIAGIPGDAAL